MLERGESLLELKMKVHVPCYGSYRARTHSMRIDRLLRGLFELGVIGEVQIVVGTKHEHLLAVDHTVRCAAPL